jgi:hypothetical protein
MATHAKASHATSRDDAVLWSMTPRSLDEMTKSYVTWLDGANKVSNEAFRFAHDRLSKDLEMAAQLMRCNDPTEAFRLQAEFASNLAGDYLIEGQKIFAWVTQLATEQSASGRQNNGGRQHTR